MKFTSLLASVALISAVSVLDVPFKAMNTQAFADMMSDSESMMRAASNLTGSQKIANLTQHKGKSGSGAELRSYFLGDLEPLSVQPGGAGMVVNLYNKANNVTIAYCATYDVVVAVKQGRVTQFASSEVK